MIRRADADAIARDALVLDLDDLGMRGQRMQAEARRRAEEIIAEANAERDRLIATASEEGRAAGMKQGLAEGQAEGRAAGHEAAKQEAAASIAAAVSALESAAAALAEQRQGAIDALRDDAVRLAAVIAERIVKRQAGTDPLVAAAQVEEALKLVARRSALTISVDPADEATVRELLENASLDRADHATLRIAEGVGRGGCVIRSDAGGVIDARIGPLLDEIVGQLLPAGEPLPIPENEPDAAAPSPAPSVPEPMDGHETEAESKTSPERTLDEPATEEEAE